MTEEDKGTYILMRTSEAAPFGVSFSASDESYTCSEPRSAEMETRLVTPGMVGEERLRGKQWET